MPAVFVHGVPDTSRVWQDVVARLPRRDMVTLSLPSFGRPTPDGFDATKEAYVRWLLDELAVQPDSIDVVGHDWGAPLVLRAVSLAPDRVRSWAVGGSCYEWHQAARRWQTPEVGERVMEATTASAMEKALAAAGVPAAAAARVDTTMKRCTPPSIDQR